MSVRRRWHAESGTESALVFQACLALAHCAQSATPEMLELLRELRKKMAIGFVGGSDFSKISEQLGGNGSNRKYISVSLQDIHSDMC